MTDWDTTIFDAFRTKRQQSGGEQRPGLFHSLGKRSVTLHSEIEADTRLNDRSSDIYSFTNH